MASPIQQEVSDTQSISNPESDQEELQNQQQPLETEGNQQDVNPPSSSPPPRPVIESERFVT